MPSTFELRNNSEIVGREQPTGNRINVPATEYYNIAAMMLISHSIQIRDETAGRG